MQRQRFCLFSTVLVVLSGCGGAGDLATVECHVSQDGEPLSGAEIFLDSFGEERVTVFGASLEGGNCIFDFGQRKGLPPGEYRITVIHYQTVDGRPLPEGEDGQTLKTDGKAVRKQFAFQKTIAAGRNSLALKLEEGEPIVDDPETIPGDIP